MHRLEPGWSADVSFDLQLWPLISLQCKEDDWTPLHFSAQAGNFEVYQFLSENLTNINPATKKGITPLHMAGKNGHFEVYKFICESTSDMNPQMPSEITPLDLAAKNGHLEVCKIIPSDQYEGLYFINSLWFSISRGRLNVTRFLINEKFESICYFFKVLFLFALGLLLLFFTILFARFVFVSRLQICIELILDTLLVSLHITLCILFGFYLFKSVMIGINIAIASGHITQVSDN